LKLQSAVASSGAVVVVVVVVVAVVVIVVVVARVVVLVGYAGRLFSFTYMHVCPWSVRITL
jgi:hypothetical protein